MKKLFAALMVLALLMTSVAALAEWPERAIEFIVPANPGGDTDANARALAAALNEEMGWDVIVTNMNGASGGVAFGDLVTNPDDGYRFVFYHNGGSISSLMGILEYNIVDDFKLVGLPFLDYSSSFLINSQNEKFNDLPSMIAYMKEHPGEVTFGTETGCFTHLQVLAFQDAAGVEFSVQDIGTASQKIVELQGNRIDVIGTQAGLVNDYLETNQFISLGIVADEQLEGRPDLLTMKEQGVDVVFAKYFYLAAPNSCDDSIVNAMNEALTKVLSNETLINYGKTRLVEITNKTPEETEAYVAEQTATYADYLKDYIE